MKHSVTVKKYNIIRTFEVDEDTAGIVIDFCSDKGECVKIEELVTEHIKGKKVGKINVRFRKKEKPEAELSFYKF